MTPHPQTFTSLEKAIPETLQFFLKNGINPKFKAFIKPKISSSYSLEYRK